MLCTFFSLSSYKVLYLLFWDNLHNWNYIMHSKSGSLGMPDNWCLQIACTFTMLHRFRWWKEKSTTMRYNYKSNYKIQKGMDADKLEFYVWSRKSTKIYQLRWKVPYWTHCVNCVRSLLLNSCTVDSISNIVAESYYLNVATVIFNYTNAQFNLWNRKLYLSHNWWLRCWEFVLRLFGVKDVANFLY